MAAPLDQLWYLEISGTRLGPYSPLAIRALFEKNEISAKDVVRPASPDAAHAGTAMTVGEFLNSGIDFTPKNPIPLKHSAAPAQAVPPSPLQSAVEPTRVLVNPGGAYELLNVLQSYRSQQQERDNSPKGRSSQGPTRGVGSSDPAKPWIFGLLGLGVSAVVAWAVFNFLGTAPKPAESAAPEIAHAVPAAKPAEEAPKPVVNVPAPSRRHLASGALPAANLTAPSSSRLQRLRERERTAAAAAAESSRDREREIDERDREPASEESDLRRGEGDRAVQNEGRRFRPFDSGLRPPAETPSEEGNDRQPDSVAPQGGSEAASEQQSGQAAPAEAPQGLPQQPTGQNEIPIASP